ncbi:hypothetical protein [Chryseolinea lacunae]|uniref:Uncharacterized protein n=1 Tax=Chryseolinea lacunae TaxID=2801331 RepID=A0ABS1KV86_9BACT|nr:hypothetical protein [Chryseolinea lacunae]MBL0743147.1 hypothetical protein [Chryseolinea lacunae]
MRSIVLFLAIALMSCQGGKIPCPRIKTAKLHKHYRPSAAALSAKAEREENDELQHQRSPSARYVQDVSVEDWDCPHPGAKKYKPKSVKENIKRNLKKINSDSQNTVPADSVSSR